MLQINQINATLLQARISPFTFQVTLHPQLKSFFKIFSKTIDEGLTEFLLALDEFLNKISFTLAEQCAIYSSFRHSIFRARLFQESGISKGLGYFRSFLAGGVILQQFISTVYSLIGFSLPLTVTRSIFLQNYFIPGVSNQQRSQLNKKSTPNCLVAAQSLEAILTFGLKQLASILYQDPIAPSIAHPTCNPNPMLTLNYPRASTSLQSNPYSKIKGSLCILTRVLTNPRTAKSARTLRYLLSFHQIAFVIWSSAYLSSGIFQTSKNASPMFLLAEPPQRYTDSCTREPILLTKIKIYSCKTQVTSVKCLISQKPKIAHFFLPSIIGFISPSSTIFDPMISAPALPKTVDKSAPILIMALLMIVVQSQMFLLSSSLAALQGSLAMSMSFSIIPSMGSTKRVSISLENSCMRIKRVMQVNKVFMMLKIAILTLYEFWFKITFILVKSVEMEFLSVKSGLSCKIMFVLIV